MDEKNLFGISSKAWTKIILFSLLGVSIIFLAIPFLLSLFLPIIKPNDVEKYEYLVDMLDGTTVLVGLFGTVASIASIIMTLADKKRYNQEKKQTENLIASVQELHKEIKDVDGCVKQTFEQNQKLALELYKNKVITVDPNTIAFGISIEEQKFKGTSWGNKSSSGEVDHD